MVRNEQLPPVSGTARAIATFIKADAEQKDVSIADLARALGKARSYASIRYNGLKTWSFDDVDSIAPILGYPDG
ncbi:hypothetical protein, partial [Bifidobacterium vansinderenii]